MKSSYRSGLLFGLVAYVCWGLVPLYFRELREVSALEILSHRIAWSLFLLLPLTFLLGFRPELVRVFRTPRLLLTLVLSAFLLSINWLLYIVASVTDRVAEASLGYYMMPLVNAFLATLILKEKLRPAHYPALVLIAVGVALPFLVAGDFTWLAVALPVTFGFYGLVRKRIAVDSFTGLTVETLVLFPPTAAFLIYQVIVGENHFGPNWSLNGLLAFSGFVTIIPLLTFTLSIRRLPLLANSFIQFLSPSMQFLLAVFLIGEQMATERWAAIGCVWAAVGIFIADAVWQARPKRKTVPVPKPEVTLECVDSA